MLVPVILSGGAGTRLWPVSREAHPKPFMQLPDGQSLLQKTYARAATLDGVSEIVTITNREYYFKTKDEYASVKEPRAKSARPLFLLEPVGRNTAPAIAVAAFYAAERYGADAIMLVLAADHLISDAAAFAKAVKQATTLAEQNLLVTFGIVPQAPETGYGYIECGAACDDKGGCKVARFVEKPSRDVAQQYVSSGRFLWNSGMFCFRVGAILDGMKHHAASIHDGARASFEAMRAQAANDAMAEIDGDSFAKLADISIDYAVMEKADNVAVVPGRFGWSDIGSWDAVGELTHPDAKGNRVVGEAVLVDVGNCFIRSDERLVAAIGLENLVIVDTPDALLVANRDRAQDVKKVVQQLKSMEHETYKLHRTVSRPWGTYTVLEEGVGFKIKRIVVKPGATLSLQMHHHRSEHWVVVSGIAKVVNGEKEFLVRKNESTYIPAGHRHRLENPGMLELVMIEVQSGDYLGEDDIQRFDDKYGRR